MKALTALLLATLLTACGGGGGDDLQDNEAAVNGVRVTAPAVVCSVDRAACQ